MPAQQGQEVWRVVRAHPAQWLAARLPATVERGTDAQVKFVVPPDSLPGAGIHAAIGINKSAGDDAQIFLDPLPRLNGFKFHIGLRVFINDQLKPFYRLTPQPQFKLAFGNADIGIFGDINIIGVYPQNFLKNFQGLFRFFQVYIRLGE